MTTQPLNNIVSISVTVSPTNPQTSTFNLGLIVGPSAIINNVTRAVTYSDTASMLTSGWAGTEPEYLAAQLYFSQTPRPTNVVIGREGTASTTLASALVLGTVYTSLTVAALTGDLASGDTVTIGSGATTQVVTTSAAAIAGATTISVTSFTASANFAIGVTVSNAETILQAVTACRAENSNWYGVTAIGAADADVEAVAAYVQSAVPTSVYFYDTADATVLAGTTPNVMSILQADKYNRTFGIYSTTAHAAAAVMGLAMGLNSGLPNSAYTLAYKSLVGVTPEVLTPPQNTAILGWNGNTYTNYGSAYDLLAQGTMADGTPFDQTLNIDVLTANIQTAIMSALTQTPKIPQTEDGVSILVNAASGACATARKTGFLAPGVWTAAPVILSNGSGLQTGATLATGYLVLADKISSQSSADRTARKSPPIYTCVKLAGAIEHVVIGIVVNQ